MGVLAADRRLVRRLTSMFALRIIPLPTPRSGRSVEDVNGKEVIQEMVNFRIKEVADR